jgi:hypothetical protein
MTTTTTFWNLNATSTRIERPTQGPALSTNDVHVDDSPFRQCWGCAPESLPPCTWLFSAELSNNGLGRTAIFHVRGAQTYAEALQIATNEAAEGGIRTIQVLA